MKYVVNPATGDVEFLNTDLNRMHTGNWTFITKKSDFPTPVGGVISIEGTYVIMGTVDLNGDRLETTGLTTIFGGSSETSYLTSTGLAPAVPLITSDWTLAMQFLTISDVHTAIKINGTFNPPVALDWTGVNFLNVQSIGNIDTCDNFVYTKGAFLNSKGLTFSGTHGTIAFNNSLFQGDGLAGNIIYLDNTVTITRRFRIIYSSVIAFGLTNGINVDVNAVVPNQSFILDTCSFSGRAANSTEYTPAVNYTDNKALFVNNTGIKNSGEISQYYMRLNATPTIITNIGVAEKVLGTTTSAPVTQKFTNTNNRATYIGSITRFFSVTATLSCTSGNNNQIGIYIAKNGNLLTESEVYITTNGAGRAEGGTVQTLVELSTNDFIEIYVENSTAITNITVTELNVVII